MLMIQDEEIEEPVAKGLVIGKLGRCVATAFPSECSFHWFLYTLRSQPPWPTSSRPSPRVIRSSSSSLLGACACDRCVLVHRPC